MQLIFTSAELQMENVPFDFGDEATPFFCDVSSEN